MIFGRPRSLSAAEKLLDLRSQVGNLVVDQAAPALSGAAAGSSRLLQQAAALLPVVMQYGDVLSGVFRWARDRGTAAVETAVQSAPPIRARRRSRWKVRLRRYAVAAAAVGAGYAVYRLTRTRR